MTRWQWYREAEARTISHAVAADRPPADRETHTAKAPAMAALMRPGRGIPLAQGLETQPAVKANDDLDRVAFPPSGLKQAIGRKPHGQAVGP